MKHHRLVIALTIVATAASARVASAQDTTHHVMRDTAMTRTHEAARQTTKIKIKNNLDAQAAISADSAQAIALAQVKGRVSSGELENENGRLVYNLRVLHDEGRNRISLLTIDANTGEVVGNKQLGGLRARARHESERRKLKDPAQAKADSAAKANRTP